MTSPKDTQQYAGEDLARLMAKAPDLLDALRVIATSHGSYPASKLRWSAMQAAYQAGFGFYPQTYTVRLRTTQETEEWSLDRILTELNIGYAAAITPRSYQPWLPTDCGWEGAFNTYTCWSIMEEGEGL